MCVCIESVCKYVCECLCVCKNVCVCVCVSMFFISEPGMQRQEDHRKLAGTHRGKTVGLCIHFYPLLDEASWRTVTVGSCLEA